ncbi:hypothetical protein SAMN05444521_5948 [Streptomyces sp. 3214.6]|nr:hypothetical protein [Streptomyces sp. 3214.6]SHI23816.1 hypothetical protein SAMN05444521_5948 [Streptomyces sp. 3214.6]
MPEPTPEPTPDIPVAVDVTITVVRVGAVVGSDDMPLALTPTHTALPHVALPHTGRIGRPRRARRPIPDSPCSRARWANSA